MSISRRFWLLAIAGVATFPISIVAHNAISSIFHVEEPVFFVLAVFVAPLATGIGLTGGLITTFLRWREKRYNPD